MNVFCRAMYHVLLIQLHHPFVATGHLSSVASTSTRNSFAVCATAAEEIVQLLITYNRTFSIRKAPYLISYATYVSATIHVRIAAQKPPGSAAHACLEACLAVLNENQATNSVVSSARLSLSNLMKRMGVVCGDDQNLSEVARTQELPTISQCPSVAPQSGMEALPNAQNESCTEPEPIIRTTDPVLGAPDFDIDMILQSFSGEQVGEIHFNAEIGHAQYHVPAPLSSYSFLDAENSHNFEAVLLDPENTGYGPAIVGDPQFIGPSDAMDVSSASQPSTLDSRALGGYTM